METREALFPAVRESVERAYAGCDGLALAMRLRVVGSTLLHAELAATAASVREEIETLAAGIASDIWIEKVEVRTSPAAASADFDPTIAGKLRQAVECLAADPWLAERLEARLAEIKIKLRLIVEAGGGLRALVDVIGKMALDADSLFATTRAGHRQFYMALDAYHAADRAAKEGLLTRDAYEETQRRCNEAQARVEEIRSKQKELAENISRHQRLVRVIPTIRELDGVDKELAAYLDLPPLRDGFADAAEEDAIDVGRICPDCGGAMHIIERIFPASPRRHSPTAPLRCDTS